METPNFSCIIPESARRLATENLHGEQPMDGHWVHGQFDPVQLVVSVGRQKDFLCIP